MRAHRWALGLGLSLGVAVLGLNFLLGVVFPAGHRRNPECADFGRHFHLPFGTIAWV